LEAKTIFAALQRQYADKLYVDLANVDGLRVFSLCHASLPEMQ